MSADNAEMKDEVTVSLTSNNEPVPCPFYCGGDCCGCCKGTCDCNEEK